MAFADLIAEMDARIVEHLGKVAVGWQPEDGSPPGEIEGIFDEGYVLAKGDADAGVSVTGPVAWFPTGTVLPSDPEDDDPTLTIGGVDYRIVEPRTDGAGGIVLVLRRLPV